ncbi:carboxylesterase/lipase family protein [Acutalibacter caecimuris]|uniref:carboxylesterase/lipase family protein n=1 Tax=Acutalibacter caecimuris TaxID=3093657 RepID=UPI002AC8F63A|nr:carboxylesterase family protein [Acutalibacter sp. M00118]
MQTIVQTKQGAVEGVLSQDGQTAIFKGVPYAAPPVGELRFRRPQAHAPWEGVRACKTFGPSCMQADLGAGGFYAKEFYDVPLPPLSEDCLYLNIWTPRDATPDSGLPVLFWIHGGAFMHGSGSEKEFDGEGFAHKGVILVTINYRVNAFGFFAHPELEEENEQGVSGNYGILDQIFALGWVRENIGSFGGDPEKITIFGQSAGCMSVQTIVSSPLSQGMMRAAILQSGGGIRALHKTPSKEQAWEQGKKLMDYLHIDTIEALRQVPAGQLREGAYATGGQQLGWTPHVDGWMLQGDVDQLAESGAIHDIVYMIGSLGDDIGGQTTLQEAGARWCENLLKLGRAPGYHYLFDRKLPGDDAGAFHSGELWYVFETQDRCWRPWEEHDRELARELSGYWANFAKNLDPNGEGLPQWPAFTPAHRETKVWQ